METPCPSIHTKQARKCVWTLTAVLQLLAQRSMSTGAARVQVEKNGRSTTPLQRHTSVCEALTHMLQDWQGQCCIRRSQRLLQALCSISVGVSSKQAFQ